MRAYNIQVNVGDLDHELMGLSEDERSEWLHGFQAGMHGVQISKRGNSFGLACFHKTKGFMDRATEGGRKSAAVRRAKTGSAQPPKGVRENTEGGSKGVRTFAEVTINQKPVTINEQPARTAHCDIFDRPEEQPEPATSTNMAACDAKYASGVLLSNLKQAMCKLTRANGNLTEWQSLVDEHGWEAVCAAAKKVRPDERWPDKVAGAIWDKDKCPHPPGSDAALNWWALHMDVK